MTFWDVSYSSHSSSALRTQSRFLNRPVHPWGIVYFQARHLIVLIEAHASCQERGILNPITGSPATYPLVNQAKISLHPPNSEILKFGFYFPRSCRRGIVVGLIIVHTSFPHDFCWFVSFRIWLNLVLYFSACFGCL